MSGLRCCAQGWSRTESTVTQGGHISTEPRINERIRVPEVRLVGPAGEQVGIVAINDALRLAQEADLDLVEVAPMARPPVAKLMDYGKFKYESALKARESRKNQAQTVIKEIKLRPKIDPHDYGTKKGHVERFLKQGDKVKVTIMFRGREQSRPELGLQAASAPGWRHRGAWLRRVLAQAGRPQHDHGDRTAQAEDRGHGRGQGRPGDARAPSGQRERCRGAEQATSRGRAGRAEPSTQARSRAARPSGPAEARGPAATQAPAAGQAPAGSAAGG